MEMLTFEFPATGPKGKSSHVGVVGSGDLEILMEPAEGNQTTVKIQTSVAGFGATWKAVLERFLQNYPVASNIEIYDFGATPGTVALRLRQAMEVSKL